MVLTDENNEEMKDFLAFCRTKPSDEEYDFMDLYGCAYAQYVKTLGYSYVTRWEVGVGLEILSYGTYRNDEGDLKLLLIDNPVGEAVSEMEMYDTCTFGQLAEVLEKKLVEG